MGVFFALFDKLSFWRPFLTPFGQKWLFLTLFSLFLTPFWPVFHGPAQIYTYGLLNWEVLARTDLGLKKGAQKVVIFDPFLTHFWTTFWPVFDRFWPFTVALMEVLSRYCQKGVSEMTHFLTHFWPLFDPFLTTFWPVFDRFWPKIVVVAAGSELVLFRRVPKMGPKYDPFLTHFWPFWTSKITHFTTFITANGHFRPLFGPLFGGLWAGLAKPANTGMNTTHMAAWIKHVVAGPARSWKRAQKRGQKWPLFWPLFSGPEPKTRDTPMLFTNFWTSFEQVLARPAQNLLKSGPKRGPKWPILTPFWPISGQVWTRISRFTLDLQGFFVDSCSGAEKKGQKRVIFDPFFEPFFSFGKVRPPHV